jgi:hypothetical protein
MNLLLVAVSAPMYRRARWLAAHCVGSVGGELALDIQRIGLQALDFQGFDLRVDLVDLLVLAVALLAEDVLQDGLVKLHHLILGVMRPRCCSKASMAGKVGNQSVKM